MKEENKEYLAINIGRPDILNEDQMEMWKQFQSYVKITPLRIVVNNAYPFIDGLIMANQYYSGDGHSYTFWLETQEDLNEFVEKLEEIFGDSTINSLQQLNPELQLTRD